MVHYIFFHCFLSGLAVGGLINLFHFFDRLRWFAQVDIFFVGRDYDCLYCLCTHGPYNIFPVVVDVFLFEHMPDGVDQLVGQQSQVNMCFNPLVVLMVYRADVQIGFQTSEGGFYFPDGIVYLP